MNDLSVADGFKFGCGFMLAALVAWLAIAIISGILAVIFGGTLAGLLERFVQAAPIIMSFV